MRGIWVQATAVENSQQAEALLARLKGCEFSTLIYNVHERGARYYSAYYPFSTAMRTGFDALQYLIHAGHAYGIDVFAWLCFGTDLYTLDSAWAIPAGGFTDFSKEGARTRMGDVVANIVNQYPELDGLALDYMRYPSIDDTSYYTSDQVTDAVSKIRTAAGDRTLVASVKAYKDDWSRWGQNWPAWLQDNLISSVMPMSYKPLSSQYGGFAVHVDRWLEVAPKDRIVPLLAVIDTGDPGEPLKPLDQIRAEISFFKDRGFDELSFFDQRATDTQLKTIYEETREDTLMGLVDQLIATAEEIDRMADAIDDEAQKQSTALREKAQQLRECAGQYTEADALADRLAQAL